MLLQVLEQEPVCPSTAAFSVDAEEFAEYRDGLRTILQKGDSKPLRALCERLAPRFAETWQRVRWRVPSQFLVTNCHLVAKTAGEEAEATLAGTVEWLERRKHVDLFPNRWLSLVHGFGLVRGLTAREDGTTLRDLVSGGLLDALRSLPLQTIDDPPDDCPPADVSWVSSLRFRADEDAPLREHVVEPAADLVLAPAGGPFDAYSPSELSPFSVLEALRERVRLLPVLERLVGPFVESRGPGPFLPPSTFGEPIEDPSWRVLPLFEVGRAGAAQHWGWPLLPVRFISPERIESAIRALKAAKPDKAWHREYSVTPVADDSWRNLVAAEWPRVRDRFLALLEEAGREKRTVVLLDAELSHAVVVPIEAHGTRVISDRR